jgi:hypothetical protein
MHDPDPVDQLLRRLLAGTTPIHHEDLKPAYYARDNDEGAITAQDRAFAERLMQRILDGCPTIVISFDLSRTGKYDYFVSVYSPSEAIAALGLFITRFAQRWIGGTR